MTKFLQILKVELAQSKDISSYLCLVQQHKSFTKVFQNIFHSGLNTLVMVSQFLEQAQHYSLLTHKSASIFIVALESFLGAYYLNILFFGHSILRAIRKPFASTISMVLYNLTLFRQANILDLFYCSCSKLDAECKTLAKTLKKTTVLSVQLDTLTRIQN